MGGEGLVNALCQGRELAKQLKDHLHKTISPQTCDFLLQNILSSYEQALSMLNPHADSYSYSSNNNNNKRRKTMEKWSEQVKEGPLSDGYSWRKYGQKDILGANHPRAYYRCTHRNVQGCLATKQVQRSDEDSSVFEVSYRGRHTCIQATRRLSKALEKKPRKQEKKSMVMDPSFSFASTPIETQKLENLFYLGTTTFNHILQTSDSDLINSTPNLDLDLDFSLDLVDFDVTDSVPSHANT